MKPVISLKKHSKKADKDEHVKSKDDTVTDGPSNSQMKDFDYQDEERNFGKTSQPLFYRLVSKFFSCAAIALKLTVY